MTGTAPTLDPTDTSVCGWDYVIAPFPKMPACCKGPVVVVSFFGACFVLHREILFCLRRLSDIDGGYRLVLSC